MLINDFTKIPFEEIVQFGQRKMLHRDLVNVSWILGRYCNYNCSYCWTHARSNTRDHRPVELIVKTIDEIKKQSRERGYNSFHFGFSGGEPTLHPGFIDVINFYSKDTLSTIYQSLHITTNLSLGLNFWEKFVKASSQLHDVGVTASWHREAGVSNLATHAKKFADKLLFLQSQNIHTTINMVMAIKYFEDLKNEALFFHEQGLNVTLKPMSIPAANVLIDQYSQEQIEFMQQGFPQRNLQKSKSNTHIPRVEPKIKVPRPIVEHQSDSIDSIEVQLKDSNGKTWYFDQAKRFNAFNFNNFYNWNCEAGLRSLIIID
ncbi:MAG: radical SAM protein [Bdellovibrio sp.]